MPTSAVRCPPGMAAGWLAAACCCSPLPAAAMRALGRQNAAASDQRCAAASGWLVCASGMAPQVLRAGRKAEQSAPLILVVSSRRTTPLPLPPPPSCYGCFDRRCGNLTDQAVLPRDRTASLGELKECQRQAGVWLRCGDGRGQLPLCCRTCWNYLVIGSERRRPIGLSVSMQAPMLAERRADRAPRAVSRRLATRAYYYQPAGRAQGSPEVEPGWRRRITTRRAPRRPSRPWAARSCLKRCGRSAAGCTVRPHRRRRDRCSTHGFAAACRPMCVTGAHIQRCQRHRPPGHPQGALLAKLARAVSITAAAAAWARCTQAYPRPCRRRCRLAASAEVEPAAHAH